MEVELKDADFSGYATKVGLECTDGRMIMPDAFKHQDAATVPLVWQHSHNDPENVLGKVYLEHRDDGVYAYAFFNATAKAQAAKQLVEHGDINCMSIWANKLMERGKRVMHGAIREVSLVLSGANPGAIIDQVRIRHSDDPEDVTALEDEAIIYTGLTLEHSTEEDGSMSDILHEDPPSGGGDGETIKDVYDSMSEKQKTVLHFMVGEALQGGSAEHSDFDEDELVVVHDDIDPKGTGMTNVFEQGGSPSGGAQKTLSHSDIESITADAKRRGSLKHAVEEYAMAHGITDIDTLFPDAQTISATPEFLSRRMEWVNKVLGGARKTPFARIKTLSADITESEARAKGYVTGEFKKEEFFSVTHRVTTPQTVYKKQKLDRDDVVDITDFDVVAWLKGEMRIMLDEELARAALIGDGRDVSDEDKIQEGNIRPIATDHELYTTRVNINLDDASSNIQEFIDAVVRNRFKYKGTGSPTLFTSETIVSELLVLKDGMNRPMFTSLQEVANRLRVAEIVPVEVMDEQPDLIAVMVNMIDYAFGTDRGGEVSMFDDFDIDYNQHKYLIETRASGALIKLKSAIAFWRTDAASVLVVPEAPDFDGEEVTINDTTHVVYKNGAGVTINAAGSPYAVAEGDTYVVNATPAAGYHFATSDDDSWSFTNNG